VSTPAALLCAECGAPMADGGVPLAALYVDADGQEVDADLGFCSPDHLDAWVDRVRPVAVARSEAEALWRGTPQTGMFGYLGCFVAILTALVVIVLVGLLVGRILG
jgi:hypothetical protein